MQTLSKLVSCCSQTQIFLFICFNYFCQVTTLSLEEGALWLLPIHRKNDDKSNTCTFLLLLVSSSDGITRFCLTKDNPTQKLWLCRVCEKVMQDQPSPAATGWLWGVTCEEKPVPNGTLKKTFLWVFSRLLCYSPVTVAGSVLFINYWCCVLS